MSATMEALKEALRKRVPKDEDSPGCQLCRMILDDLEKNGHLTGAPHDYANYPIFPKKGKLDHLKLEGILFLESEL